MVLEWVKKKQHLGGLKIPISLPMPPYILGFWGDHDKNNPNGERGVLSEPQNPPKITSAFPGPGHCCGWNRLCARSIEGGVSNRWGDRSTKCCFLQHVKKNFTDMNTTLPLVCAWSIKKRPEPPLHRWVVGGGSGRNDPETAG